MNFEELELELKIECDEALENLEKNLSKITLGGANPQLISTLKINYYDSLTPVGDLVSITHPEPQQLLIKPFDRSLNKEIYNLIVKQNYSLIIQDEGDKLRIIFPTLTTEKRKESVKQLSIFKEQAKIKIRNSRQNILKKIKSSTELNEDLKKTFQNDVQKIIDDKILLVDKIIKTKEDQLMKF